MEVHYDPTMRTTLIETDADVVEYHYIVSTRLVPTGYPPRTQGEVPSEYPPNPLNTLWVPSGVAAKYRFTRQCDDTEEEELRATLSPWVLRIELNEAHLIEKGILAEDLAAKLTSDQPGPSTHSAVTLNRTLRCRWTPFCCMLLYENSIRIPGNERGAAA